MPDIKVMDCVWHFLSNVFHKLNMSVRHHFTYFQIVPFKKVDAPDKSFFFHVEAPFYLITLQKNRMVYPFI